MAWLVGTVCLVAALYLAFALLLFAFQRRLLYQPSRMRIPPASLALPSVREVAFHTGDGHTLVCWHLPPAVGKPTLLYFHGNGGGLAHRRDRFMRCASEGLGLFMASYRGYSGSTGHPAEKHIVADALALYDTLAQSGTDLLDSAELNAGGTAILHARMQHTIGREQSPRAIAAEPALILYGESLGTGIAVQVAAQRNPVAVILEAPYTSIAEVAQALYPFLPVRPFIHDKFDSLKWIGAVRVPVLILHGQQDSTIPVRLGRRLFAAAPEPKQLAILPTAGHNDLYTHGAWDVVQSFLKEMAAAGTDTEKPVNAVYGTLNL